MRRRLQDLTIKDDFMFAAVMADPQQCRRLLTMVLEMDILEVTVIAEKSLSYLPDTYVIFICDFDLFGRKLYRYTFRNVCKENGMELNDGNTTVFY